MTCVTSELVPGPPPGSCAKVVRTATSWPVTSMTNVTRAVRESWAHPWQDHSSGALADPAMDSRMRILQSQQQKAVGLPCIGAAEWPGNQPRATAWRPGHCLGGQVENRGFLTSTQSAGTA